MIPAQSPARILAVILNYTRHEQSVKAAHSLLAQRDVDLHVLIVDNGSPNGSLSYLREAFPDHPRVSVLGTGRNLGYAAGNNAGIRWSLHQPFPEYYLIANDDVEITESDVLSRLVSFARSQHDLAGVQPRVELPDGLIQGPYSRPSLFLETVQHLAPPLWALIRAVRQHRLRNLKQPMPCHRPIGAFFLVDAAAFLEVGLFDETTFLYREEDILAERMARNGRRFYYYPGTKVIHHHDRTFVHRVNSDSLRIVENSNRYYFRTVRNKQAWRVNLLLAAMRFHHAFYRPLLARILSGGRSV